MNGLTVLSYFNDVLNFVAQMYIEKDSKYMLKNNEYCKNKLVNLCLIQFCGKGL